MPPPSRRILILGAGELGLALVEALLAHPSYNATKISLSLAIRPSTLASISENPSTLSSSSSSSSNTNITITDPRLKHLSTLRSTHSIALTAIDLTTTPLATLTALFQPYTTIIHAGAMTLPPGTQLKVTHAATQAHIAEYIPWQWGVDYDEIGAHGGLGLFAEQCEVRAHLRSQSTTAWLIVSCGVFMSFLFEEFWGVVVRDREDSSDKKKIVGVRALGGWDHGVTVTSVRDIARCAAELVLGDRRTGVVYIAGETLRYSEFADLLQRVVGRELSRELWTTAWLREQAEKEEEDKLWRYRVVFSEGVGLSWPKEGSYNEVKGIEMQGVEEWMKENGLC